MIGIKVQEIDTARGRRWLVLDGEYRPVKAFKDFLLFIDYTNRSENTLRTYAYNLKLYGDYLELRGLDLFNLSEHDGRGPLSVLSDFMIWLQYPDIVDAGNIVFVGATQSRRRPGTINAIMGTVLALYDFLARNGMATPLDAYRDKMDMRDIKPFLYELQHRKHSVRESMLRVADHEENLEYIDFDMYRRMLKACGSWRDRALIAVMFEGGLRLGEALGLHVSDIEVWNNRINIVSRPNPENHCHVKNCAEGAVYVSVDTMEYITQYFAYERDGINSDYVFVNLHGTSRGRPMQPDTVEKLFLRLSKALGSRIHPHMCRHGCATTRLEAGWDEASIQRQMRHVSLSSTKIYEHFSDALLMSKSREYFAAYGKKLEWEDTHD